VGGRGLALVAAVSRAWGTEAVPEAKVVWVDLAPEANAEPVVTG
jgi:hypothetical protein